LARHCGDAEETYDLLMYVGKERVALRTLERAMSE
jgi:hypothetical protein